MPRPFTLVIAGPIASRFSPQINEDCLIDSIKIIKKLNSMNEVIISTYENEVSERISKAVDLLLINEDPGPDYLKASPWPVGSGPRRKTTNNSRMFVTSLSGIEKAKNPLVIKTRIELLPVGDDFESWFIALERELTGQKVGFFTETYTGVSFSVNGLLGVLPDVLMVGEKSIIQNIWSDASLFWSQNRTLLTRKMILYPLGCDQILGMCYLARYHNFPIQRYKRRLRRQFISLSLLRAVVRAERDSYIWTRYRHSGFSVNYFKGIYNLRIPDAILPRSKREFCLRLLIMLLKKPKHHYRRLFIGYLTEFRRLKLKLTSQFNQKRLI